LKVVKDMPESFDNKTADVIFASSNM